MMEKDQRLSNSECCNLDFESLGKYQIPSDDVLYKHDYHVSKKKIVILNKQLTSRIFIDSPNKSTVTLNVADRGKYDFGEKMTLLS
jgi:hypothetical protein